TRKQIDAQIASARKLLDTGDAAGAQGVLRAALQKFPSDRGLQALLAIVGEAAARADAERRKSDYIQRAKDAIRRKAFPDAIQLLETARAELGGNDFDDLLQFARDEATALERRVKVDAAAERAQSLMSSEDYEGAVKFLE